MSSFKLIALQPLEGCAPYIIKCLKAGTFYYLCNDYTIAEDGKSYKRRSENIDPLHDDFFIINDREKKESNGVSINFSAIVGKNGDGKSTIIELVARIINNLARAKNFCTKDDNLIMVEGVCAELYYELDGNIYCIRQLADPFAVSVYKLGHKENNVTTDEYRLLSDDEIKDHLFYTFISNYSLYAYNDYEFVNEWEDKTNIKTCWIDKVFHKNDGYKMPLTIFPQREHGVIDINEERELSDQRIISLMINADTSDNGNNFRIVNDKEAKYLDLKLSDTSKFLQHTLVDHLRTLFNVDLLHVREGYGYDVFLSYSNGEPRADDAKTGFVLKDNLKAYFEEIKEKVKYVNELYNKNESFIKYAHDYLKNSQVKSRDFISQEQDIHQLMEVYRSLLSIIDNNPNYVYIPENHSNQTTNDKDLVINMPKFIEGYSLAQIQWLILVSDVCKIWENDFKGKPIIKKNDSFRLKKDKLFSDYIKLSLKAKCYHYIIYKIIDILDNYEIFGKPLNRYIDFFKSVEHEDLFDVLSRSIKLVFNDVYDLKTHITLKLRQTLNYLHEDLIGTNKDIYQKMAVQTKDGNTYEVTLDSLKDKYEKKIKEKNDSILNILPPPIYDCHLIFVPNSNPALNIPMEQLSSGERQRLNSLSAIIYHLQNIESVGNDKERASYSHVNIFLEEIELYFHPEYQRRCVNELRKALIGCKFEHIKAVNLTLVTHSPFILSDIPMTNVLFLKDGKPVREMQQNTFGANIHSLLKNGFFMPTLPIGEFANDKINELFYLLNTGDFKEEEKKSIYEDIQRIGEPYIKSQLMGMYKSYDSNDITPSELRDFKSKVGSLEEEIRTLKSQLNNNNDRH